MTDSDPVAAEPGQTAAPAPELPLLPLAERYPAGFDGERPRPLKIGIHKHLIRAGHDRVIVMRSLKTYCTAPRYRASLRAGTARIDLQGQPAGLVTEREAAHAREEPNPRAAERTAKRAASSQDALPPDATPIPKENLVPGRLELTVKFSELPQPLAVQGGLKIGVQTGEGIVTALLPVKVWRKLEQAAKDYPQWVAALSGSLDRCADGEIALKHPALQVFEKKTKPAAASESKAPEMTASAMKAPEPNRPEVKPPNAKMPEVKASDPKASDATAPNSKAPDPKAPAVKASEGKAPELKAPPTPSPTPTFPKLSLKPRGASEAG